MKVVAVAIFILALCVSDAAYTMSGKYTEGLAASMAYTMGFSILVFIVLLIAE